MGSKNKIRLKIHASRGPCEMKGCEGRVDGQARSFYPLYVHRYMRLSCEQMSPLPKDLF